MLAVDVIELGPQTGFADQPYVEVEFFDDSTGAATGLGPYGSEFGMGLYAYNRFLLDTGANSILSAKSPTNDLVSHGYRTEGTYRELGVAGYTEFDISAPYRIEVTGTEGASLTLPQTADGTRIMSSTEVELGGPLYLGGVAGLVGMPAMVNRVTTLDLGPLAEVTDLFEMEPMSVLFSDTLPPVPEGSGGAHRFSVAVDDRISFDVADGLPPDAPPDAPLPVWAPIPFLTAVGQVGNTSAQGNFLLDTGAQMTIISTSLAFSLGLDEDGDGDFENEKHGSIAVGGVGGSREVPVLMIDQLRLPTEQGPELAWLGTDPAELGLEVLVLDIAPGIDGVLGVDLLTSGLGFDIDPNTWEITTSGAPYFSKIHFDFRHMMQDGTGTIEFDLNPYRAQVTPSGSATKVTAGGQGDTYEIVLWTQPTSPMRIDLTSYEGRLLAVDDANPTNEYLRFTPDDWNVAQTVRVTAVDDTVVEGHETDWITHTSLSTDSHFDNLRISSVMTEIVDGSAATTVMGRHVFYNGSSFDGKDHGVNAADDQAIATDKQALLPGETATSANYTSYTRGLSGLMIDVDHLADAGAIGIDDFQFHVGNDDGPNDWAVATSPTEIGVRQGAGVHGADRITLVWDEGAVTGQWLQVTVLASSQTGLAEDDVFYFGNAIGAAGIDSENGLVTVADESLVRNNRRGPDDLALIDDPFDFNGDRLVDVADRLIARNNQTGLADALQLISPPALGLLAAAADAAFATDVVSVEDESIGSLSMLMLVDWIEQLDDPHERSGRSLTLQRVSDTFWAWWGV